LRIAVAATPEVAIASLEKLLSSGQNLSLVLTQPDRPAGRGRQVQESAVSKWAHQKGIPTVKPEGVAEILASLADIDLLITIGYGVLLPIEVLKKPKFGCINLHFSLLPRWRGAAPVQRAIEARDSLTGVTVFALDEGMDTGPIYLAKRFALDSDITSDELFIELAELGALALLEALEMIAEGRPPAAQPSTGQTRALKLSKEEGAISWSHPSEVVSAKIRAFTSEPGAWTTFRGSSIIISKVAASEEVLSPGELRFTEKTLLVGTATKALAIYSVRPAGRSTMDASSWANGARLQDGDHFG
jgi:methionyl-tRNA formyltransferase